MKNDLLDKSYDRVIIDSKIFEHLIVLFFVSLIFLFISFGIYKGIQKEWQKINKIEWQIKDLNYKTETLKKKINNLKEMRNVMEKREEHIR